jgi:hypothetical protein
MAVCKSPEYFFQMHTVPKQLVITAGSREDAPVKTQLAVTFYRIG